MYLKKKKKRNLKTVPRSPRRLTGWMCVHSKPRLKLSSTTSNCRGENLSCKYCVQAHTLKAKAKKLQQLHNITKPQHPIDSLSHTHSCQSLSFNHFKGQV